VAGALAAWPWRIEELKCCSAEEEAWPAVKRSGEVGGEDGGGAGEVRDQEEKNVSGRWPRRGKSAGLP
jgi:hypothetical protein